MMHGHEQNEEKFPQFKHYNKAFRQGKSVSHDKLKQM